ncbi:MAG: hypothetical protein LRY73_17060 [Bacillus sp. (in: Bacteria)]|nr:hypothetical protein [Bacillus sp. (in: firmicutes)]
MKKEIVERLTAIFNQLEIFTDHCQEPVKINEFSWNGSMEDFVVEYYIRKKKYVFHYNRQLLTDSSNTVKTDPVEQLKDELEYIKRMHERGIGSKEYYPMTQVER